MTVSIHKVYDTISAVVLISSTLYSFLPAWEDFNDYPKFQKAYKFVLIFVMKFASFNFRNVMLPHIKTTDAEPLPEPPKDK